MEEYEEMQKESKKTLDDFEPLNLEKGEISKKAIVRTSAKATEVNAPTIEDIKSIHNSDPIKVDQLEGVIQGGDGIIAEPSEDGSRFLIHLDEHIEGNPVLLPMSLNQTGNTFESVDDFTSTLHVIVEIEGNGVHTSASFDLPHYNGSICLVPFKYVHNGNIVDGYASIHSDGRVNIQLPTVTSEEVHAKYFEYEE